MPIHKLEYFLFLNKQICNNLIQKTKFFKQQQALLANFDYSKCAERSYCVRSYFQKYDPEGGGINFF